MTSVESRALEEDFHNIQLQLLMFPLLQLKSWVTWEEQFFKLFFAHQNSHSKNCKGQFKIEIILPDMPPFFPHFFLVPAVYCDLGKFTHDLLLFQEEAVTVRANQQ